MTRRTESCTTTVAPAKGWSSPLFARLHHEGAAVSIKFGYIACFGLLIERFRQAVREWHIKDNGARGQRRVGRVDDETGGRHAAELQLVEAIGLHDRAALAIREDENFTRYGLAVELVLLFDDLSGFRVNEIKAERILREQQLTFRLALSDFMAGVASTHSSSGAMTNSIWRRFV